MKSGVQFLKQRWWNVQNIDFEECAIVHGMKNMCNLQKKEAALNKS